MVGQRASTPFSAGKWRLLLLTATLLCTLSNSSLALEVSVSNDGPSILDSPITFRAELLAGELSTLYYVFQHNVPTAAQPQMITSGTVAVLPMTFLSERDLPGEYVMRVSVLKDHFFVKRKIAEGSCNFMLTQEIVGKIVISQDGQVLPDNQTIVSTNRTTNFTFEFHDPSGYFNNSRSGLSWKLDHGKSHIARYLTVNFADSEDHSVDLTVVALVNSSISTPPEIKIGSFERNVSSRENIVGKIVVSQGGHVLPDNQTVVTTNQTANFTFDLHDPGRFFNSSFKAMSWKLDHGLAHYNPYFTLNFTDTDVHSVHLAVVELVDTPNSTAPLIKHGSFTRKATPTELRKVSGQPIVPRRHPRRKITRQAQLRST